VLAAGLLPGLMVRLTMAAALVGWGRLNVLVGVVPCEPIARSALTPPTEEAI
jgi:hypothetical protein